jgi:DNA repair photolyase
VVLVLVESKMSKISGTKEWAAINKNCLIGCSHDCRYCYARTNAIRFRLCNSLEEWPHPVVIEKELKKPVGKKKGTIMFPSTHDILPEFLDVEMEIIEKLLKPGNKVLIVSKPHYECIKTICDTFTKYKDKILFRFTIGAIDDAVLKYWEPNAPRFIERLHSLRLAFLDGYNTSVSIEPMLDSEHIIDLYETLVSLVTDSIWIGKMNQIKRRVAVYSEEDLNAIEKIEAGQTDEKIRQIYEALKDKPYVRWKESIKEVVGLPLAENVGEDR